MTGRKPLPTPEQLAVGTVDTRIGAHPDGPEWAEAERDRVLDARQITVGVSQHATTGLYQVWVSLYGVDVTSWGAFRDAAQAEHWARTIGEAAQAGEFGTVENISALLDQVMAASDGAAVPFDDDTIRAIGAAIARRAQRRN